VKNDSGHVTFFSGDSFDEGYIVLHDFTKRFYFMDVGGNLAVITVLKHELGHLFGLKHDEDERSFMHTPSSYSLGLWSRADIDGILKNKYKKWF
jgi:predicted Zn-dependent protease